MGKYDNQVDYDLMSWREFEEFCGIEMNLKSCLKFHILKKDSKESCTRRKTATTHNHKRYE